MTRHDPEARPRRLKELAGRAEPVPKPGRLNVAITDLTARCVQEPVSKRVYVVVMIQTDAGVTGVGETVARPDPAAAVARILSHRQALVGQDATAVEVVRQSIISTSERPNTERAPVNAAVNMAMLDVLGKLAGVPVHEVLGGPTRNKVRALAYLAASPGDELQRAVQKAGQAGFRAFVVPLRLPDGPARGRAFYRQTRSSLEALRAAAGDGSDFVLDCGGRLAPAEAAGLARELERFHLLWLDEPVGGIDPQSLVRVAGESVTPLGCGRAISDNHEFLEILRLDAVDALRPDVCLNGITSIRKAAALAETYYVAVAPFHRGGPIATAAALHLAASIPNFFIQEVPFPLDERDRQMRRELAGDELEVVKDGFLALSRNPGLGITLNEDAIRKYEVK